MADNDPKNNDGLSPEELDQQEVSNLPNREAMSLISPDPVTPTYFDGDPILDQNLDPGYFKDPIIKPTA
jgi:hypothetical protein